MFWRKLDLKFVMLECAQKASFYYNSSKINQPCRVFSKFYKYVYKGLINIHVKLQVQQIKIKDTRVNLIRAFCSFIIVTPHRSANQ